MSVPKEMGLVYKMFFVERHFIFDFTIDKFCHFIENFGFVIVDFSRNEFLVDFEKKLTKVEFGVDGKITELAIRQSSEDFDDFFSICVKPSIISHNYSFFLNVIDWFFSGF